MKALERIQLVPPLGNKKLSTESAARPEAANTGAESLAVVLKLNKVAADAAAIQNSFSPYGEFGALDLVRAAKRMGVKARLTQARTEELLRLPLPAVGQAKDGSFFVIARANDTEVLVQTPGQAPEMLSVEALSDRWNGQIILIAMRASLLSEETKFSLRWFFQVIKKYKGLAGEILLASFFIQLFALVTPIFFQVVVDKVLVHQGLTTLDVLALGMLVIALFEILMGGLRSYIFTHTSSRVDVELSSRLFGHLMRLPLQYFENRQVGQTVARVGELQTIREFLTGSALTVVLDSFFTVVFFAVMYVYSPTLFWISFASVPLFVLISVCIAPGLRRRVEEKFQRGAVQQAFLTEAVAGIETVKAMAVEPVMQKRWEEYLAAFVKSNFNAVMFSTVGSQLVQLVTKLVTIVILWVGARLVINGDLSVGQLIAFNMLAGQVNGPIIRLAQLWQDFQQMRISVERIGDVLNCPPEPGYSPGRSALPSVKGAVTFDHVSFRYAPGRPYVVDGLSLDIKPGEVIGVVGRSGSGKSTLTKLLQRLYQPESGRVLVDGVDLSIVDAGWLRRQIGVVLQENLTFHGTVRDNIAVSNPAMPMQQIVEAAQMAGAHEFILELSNGYDTVLEERGSNLSGGQRQRMAIARALAAQPRILIFDEATSALDYESERIIQDNMRRICCGRTVIVVAHRLSTVRASDRIIVLDKGRIAEVGRHEALVKQNGIYAELHRYQSGQKP